VIAPGGHEMVDDSTKCAECEWAGKQGQPEMALVGVYVQRQPDGSWSIDHVGESVDFWCGAEEGHYMEDAGPVNSVARFVEAALGLGPG